MPIPSTHSKNGKVIFHHISAAKARIEKLLKAYPPNLPCRVQVRTRKMERSSSTISRQRRLVLKNRKRHNPPNLPCRVQLCIQNGKVVFHHILEPKAHIEKPQKAYPPNLPCQVQVRTRKMERLSSIISQQQRHVSKNYKRCLLSKNRKEAVGCL